MEWILSRERVQGRNEGTVAIRPTRVAYIIPDDDPETALRAIEACCLTWGGVLNPLIPYSRKRGLSETWRGILGKLDPDTVVDCAGLDEETRERFERAGQDVHRWENPQDSLLVVGTMQYTALRAFGRGVLYEVEEITTGSVVVGLAASPVQMIVPLAGANVASPSMEPSSNPLRLPVYAQFGRLNEQFAGRLLAANGWSSETRYSHYARLVDVDPSTPSQALAELLSSKAPDASGASRYHSLLNLTKLGLVPHGPAYDLGGGTVEDPQSDEPFQHRILVTGDDGSVSDLCLYWVLRMERPYQRFLPLWIPLSILETSEGLEAAQAALGLEDRLGSSLLPRQRQCAYVVSTSVQDEVLKTRLGKGITGAQFVTRGLGRFVSGRWGHYHSMDTSEVVLSDGVAHLRLPRPRTLEGFGPLDEVHWEVSLARTRIPQSPSLEAQRLSPSPRKTRTGYARHVTPSLWPARVGISVPSGWAVLASLFADAGYECSPSDKGRLAVGVLNLLGGLGNMRVLASSKVFDALRSMSLLPEERVFEARRPAKTHGQLKEFWEHQKGMALLDWLLDRNIVSRGVEMKCPTCQLKEWYALDRLTKRWRCDGCQTEQAVPLMPDRTDWQYRVNELYARGLDQGVIDHLLLMNAVHLRWQSEGPALLGYAGDVAVPEVQGAVVMGYYPGVEIHALQDGVAKATGIAHMELDLVAVKDERLVVAECKGLGEELSEEQAMKYVTLANHVGCSRIMFMTHKEFSQDTPLRNKCESTSSAAIEWWSRDMVLDSVPIAVSLDALDDSTEAEDEDLAVWYFGEVVRSLERDLV
ncbi:MAG: hypothetical protein ISS55_04845 [Dehalococcoidales bacterium]|nr:hypothetical protein [Dehalococcoidales bacterium]